MTATNNITVHCFFRFTSNLNFLRFAFAQCWRCVRCRQKHKREFQQNDHDHVCQWQKVTRASYHIYPLCIPVQQNAFIHLLRTYRRCESFSFCTRDTNTLLSNKHFFSRDSLCITITSSTFDVNTKKIFFHFVLFAAHCASCTASVSCLAQLNRKQTVSSKLSCIHITHCYRRRMRRRRKNEKKR